MREDSLASLHGREAVFLAADGYFLTHQCRYFRSTWAAYVGMPRRYVDVVSPCDEVKNVAGVGMAPKPQK